MAINEAFGAGRRASAAGRGLRALDVATLIAEPLPVAPAQAAPAPGFTGSLHGVLRRLLGADPAGDRDQQLKAALAQVGEAMLEGLLVCASDGRIAYVNDNLCRLVGRKPAELAGKHAAQHFSAICPPSACVKRGGARVIRRERREAELRTKAGGALVVEACSEGIAGASGELVGWFAVVADITARANALRQSESEVRLLSAQFVAAQELERQRIARELHDSIGQSLGALKFGLEGCEAMIAAGSCESARVGLGGLVGRIQSMVDEVRRISMNLRPSTLDDLGILPTLAWFAREFRAIHDKVRLEMLAEVREEAIAPVLKTAIYRIVQEAVNNSVTHSGARNIALALRRRGAQLELELRDDGTGFDPAAFRVADESGRGLGLASMRERAEVTGGRFVLATESGAGTTIRVAWPIGSRGAE
jgi:PAS domain S-box-containing protein